MVSPFPPTIFPDQEDRSPFSGLPLSELDRLGLPRPNYNWALANMALMSKYKELLESGLSKEEAKRKLQSLAAELINSQSRLNQAIQII